MVVEVVEGNEAQRPSCPADHRAERHSSMTNDSLVRSYDVSLQSNTSKWPLANSAPRPLCIPSALL